MNQDKNRMDLPVPGVFSNQLIPYQGLESLISARNRLFVVIFIGWTSYFIIGILGKKPWESYSFFEYLHNSIFSTICVYLLAEGVYQICRRRQRSVQYPVGHTIQRFIIQFALVAFYSFVVNTGMSFLYIVLFFIPNELKGLGFFFFSFYFNTFGLLISFVFAAIINTVYFFEEWRKSAVQMERLEKESLLTRYEALKTQISPHFLFNNFTVLRVLIDQDHLLAKQYIDNLSEVFRYIVESRDQEFVSLAEELRFAQTFGTLMQIRFGSAITIHQTVEPHLYQTMIPPVILQMLLENAMKHNIATTAKPLIMNISNEGDEYVVVRNPLQPKMGERPSTKIGLKNIIRRYELLTDKRVIIDNSGEEFIVKIPLLELSHETLSPEHIQQFPPSDPNGDMATMLH